MSVGESGWSFQAVPVKRRTKKKTKKQINKQQQNRRDSNNPRGVAGGGGAEAKSHTHLEAMRSGDGSGDREGEEGSGLRSSSQNDKSAVVSGGGAWWWWWGGGWRGPTNVATQTHHKATARD